MKTDGCKLGHITRDEIHIRAAQQVEAGESLETFIKFLSFRRACLSNWIARYREGGIGVIETKQIAGRPSSLKGNQIKKIYDSVKSKNPLQLQFLFALWTREMI